MFDSNNKVPFDKNSANPESENFIVQLISLKTLQPFNILATDRIEMGKILQKLPDSFYIHTIQTVNKLVAGKKFLEIINKLNKADDMNFGNNLDEENTDIEDTDEEEPLN